jgi:hypothetical protein
MKINILPFPSDASIAYSALEHFYKHRIMIVTVVAPVVFMGRILINQLLLKDAKSYAELLKDLAVMFLCLAAFPEFVRLIVEIPEMAHESLRTADTINIQAIPIKVEDMSGYMFYSNLSTIGDIISVAVYWICYAVFQGILFVLVMIAAWAIMAGTLAGIPFLLPVFFLCLLLTSLWPLLWYGINIAIIDVLSAISSPGPVSKTIVSLATDFIRLLAPVFIIKKSWHSKAANFIRERISDGKSAVKFGYQAPGKALNFGKSLAANTTSRLSAAADATGFHKEAQWMRNKQMRAAVHSRGLSNNIKQGLKSSGKAIGPGVKSALTMSATGGASLVVGGAKVMNNMKSKLNTKNEPTSNSANPIAKTGGGGQINNPPSISSQTQYKSLAQNPTARLIDQNRSPKHSGNTQGVTAGSSPRGVNASNAPSGKTSSQTQLSQRVNHTYSPAPPNTKHFASQPSTGRLVSSLFSNQSDSSGEIR